MPSEDIRMWVPGGCFPSEIPVGMGDLNQSSSWLAGIIRSPEHLLQPHLQDSKKSAFPNFIQHSIETWDL